MAAANPIYETESPTAPFLNLILIPAVALGAPLFLNSPQATALFCKSVEGPYPLWLSHPCQRTAQSPCQILKLTSNKLPTWGSERLEIMGEFIKKLNR